ncbi:MAG: LamG-like jellyroll fold domain-containing protein [Phycisphaerae bacterium]
MRKPFRFGVFLAAIVCCWTAQQTNAQLPAGYQSMLTFGLIADIHHANRPDTGRYYSAALDKTQVFADHMNDLGVDFVVELGDFKDQYPTPNPQTTKQYLEEVEAVYQTYTGPTYHVLGNHDLDSISKTDFQARVTNTGIDPSSTYYSFNHNGVHFVTLDACFTSDGTAYDSGNFDWTDANIPQQQLEWLATDLAAVEAPTVIFIHQTLDRPDSDSLNVKNGTQVRSILEADGQVQAVFQGHHHSGGYSQINGIHYMTTVGNVGGGTDPVADNAYSTVTLGVNIEDGSYAFDVVGYGRQGSRVMVPAAIEEITPAVLLAYYPFDTATGLTDASGNGHDGSARKFVGTSGIDHGLPGIATDSVKLGDGALRLIEDGTLNAYTSLQSSFGQYVEIDSVLDELSTGDDTSVSLWFKTDHGDQVGTYTWNSLFVGSNTASGNLYRIGIDPETGGIFIDTTSSAPGADFNDQKWHHLAVVHDGETGEQVVYVDGTVLPGFTSKVIDWDAAAFMQLGMEYDGSDPGDFFGGWLDDLAIYRGKLTQEQVEYLYNGGAGNVVPEPACLSLLALGGLALLRRRKR